MHRLLVSTALVLALVGAPALAADLTAKGSIKSMDTAKCTVTLADGKVYQFPAKCDFTKLKANENVVITYTVKGAVNEATKIAAG
ncbi:MAG: DUF1344 domain-containing protein [Devosia sp.]